MKSGKCCLLSSLVIIIGLGICGYIFRDQIIQEYNKHWNSFIDSLEEDSTSDDYDSIEIEDTTLSKLTTTTKKSTTTEDPDYPDPDYQNPDLTTLVSTTEAPTTTTSTTPITSSTTTTVKTTTNIIEGSGSGEGDRVIAKLPKGTTDDEDLQGSGDDYD